MIPCDQPPGPEQACATIRRQLLEAWSGPRGARIPPQIEEAAAAVAAYCAHDLDCQALGDRHLALLFSRALCRAGEEEAARQLLGEEGADPIQAASCLALLGGVARPWPAVDWLARRVFRASLFTAFGGGICWTLDWRRLEPAAGPALEFAYVGLLRTLVLGVSPLWDPTQGRGTLAHSGLPAHLALALGGNRIARQEWTQEVMDTSRGLLAHEAGRRGWLHTPDCRLVDAAY